MNTSTVYRNRWKAEGRCYTCGEVRLHTKTLCVDCCIHLRVKQKEMRDSRLKAGLCVKCGKNPIQVYHSRCNECNKKDRQFARKRRDSKPYQKGKPGRPPVIE